MKGNNRINSTSKIKKIFANKKNRSLKGIKPRDKVLNPHSKDLLNSKSLTDFFLKIKPAKKITNLRAAAQKKINKVKKISFKILNFANLCNNIILKNLLTKAFSISYSIKINLFQALSLRQ